MKKRFNPGAQLKEINYTTRAELIKLIMKIFLAMVYFCCESVRSFSKAVNFLRMVLLEKFNPVMINDTMIGRYSRAMLSAK